MTTTTSPGRVRVEGRDVTVECRPGETVLAALHRAGVAARAGCRRGGCGICRLDVVDGEVEHTHVIAERALAAADRAAGACLSCRATPRGDVTVAVPSADVSGATAAVLAIYSQAAARPGATRAG